MPPNDAGDDLEAASASSLRNGGVPEGQQPRTSTQGVHGSTAGQMRRISFLGDADGMQGRPPVSATQHWATSSSAIAAAQYTARKEQEAAKIKALQRMPYPMVISRMKLLLERLHTMQAAAQASSYNGTMSCGGVSSHVTADMLPSGRFARMSTLGGTSLQHGVSRPGSAAASITGAHTAAAHATGRPRSAAASITGAHASLHGVGRPGSAAVSMPGGRLISMGGMLTGHGHDGRARSTAGGASVYGRSVTDARRSEFDGADNTVALQKTMEELQVMFSFVSDFIRRLPAAARIGMASVVRVESFKKDQIIFDTGDVATAFYIILTGSVQVWGHPPGNIKQKTVFATLSRGEMFGDLALLNNAKRGAAVSPLTSATMLVVDKDEFLEVLGPHFIALHQTMRTFLQKEVLAFAGASAQQIESLCRNLMHSRHKQHKEFEVASEAQVYFLAEGTAHLEYVGKRAAHGAAHAAGSSSQNCSGTSPRLRHSSPGGEGGCSSRRRSAGGMAADAAAAGRSDADAADAAAMHRHASFSHPCGDDDESFALSETGRLADVRMQHGVAIGTLGLDRHSEAVRRRNAHKSVIAKLERGACFGGGPTLMGGGELQGHLRVVITSELAEVYRIDVDAFAKHATPILVKALRDDMAFRLTYWLGRNGTIGPDTVVGHPEAAIITKTHAAAADDEDVASTISGRRSSCGAAGQDTAKASGLLLAGAVGVGAKGDAGASSCGAGPGAVLKASMAAKRTTRVKPDHVAGSGRFAPGTMSAIKYIQELQTQLGLAQDSSSSSSHSRSGSGSSSTSMSSSSSGGYSTTSSSLRNSMWAGAGPSSSRGTTAAQRFWSNPENSASGTPLTPLLRNLYSEGLAPLAEKLDDVAVRAEKRGQEGLAALVASSGISSCGSAAQPGTRSSTCGMAGAPAARHSSCGVLGLGNSTGGAMAAALSEGGAEGRRSTGDAVGRHSSDGDAVGRHSNDGDAAAIPATSKGDAEPTAVSPARQRPSTASAAGILQRYLGSDASSMVAHGCKRPASALPSWSGQQHGSWGLLGSGGGPEERLRPSTAGTVGAKTAMRHERPGSLIAAGIIWSRTSDSGFRPPLRQCLTYEEICSSKGQERPV